jgi:hypothetical protein
MAVRILFERSSPSDACRPVIIALSDRAFIGGASAEVAQAIVNSILAFQQGHHAFIVSPAGYQAAIQSTLEQSLKDEVQLIHRNWLEGQGLARKATRIASITGDPQEHGRIEGNAFYVYAGRLHETGLTREASHVVESIVADHNYLKLLMRMSLDMNDVELRRFWFSRADQGGGGAVTAYVDRFIDQPSPTFILCDRDGPDPACCGPTAQGCIEAMVVNGLYATEADARAGGFSRSVPAFGFRVLAAHEMENLILPRIADIYLRKVVAPARSVGRLAAIRQLFPAFPALNNEQAEQWLRLDFKKFPEFGKMFSSETLKELSQYSIFSRQNFEELRSAARLDFQRAPFYLAVSDIVRDIWTTGACQRMLT